MLWFSNVYLWVVTMIGWCLFCLLSSPSKHYIVAGAKTYHLFFHLLTSGVTFHWSKEICQTVKITSAPTAVWVFGFGDDWLCKTAVRETASAVHTKVEIFMTVLLQVENKAAVSNSNVSSINRCMHYWIEDLNHQWQKRAQDSILCPWQTQNKSSTSRMWNDTCITASLTIFSLREMLNWKVL